MWALDHFGPQFWELSPQTVAMDVEEDTGVRLSPSAMSRLMAAATVVTTDYFSQSLPRFIQLANALCGSPPDDEFDPADPYECAWALTEALVLDPPEDGEEKFCDDVRVYLAEVLKEYGFVTPPDVLRLAIGADLSARVKYDFGDDPEMFAAINDVQRGKAEEVNGLIRDNLTLLVSQLRSLPLKEGSVAGFCKNVETVLAKADEAGDPHQNRTTT